MLCYNAELADTLPTILKEFDLELKIDLPNIRGWFTKNLEGNEIMIWSVLVLQEDGTTKWERLPPGLACMDDYDIMPQDRL